MSLRSSGEPSPHCEACLGGFFLTETVFKDDMLKVLMQHRFKRCNHRLLAPSKAGQEILSRIKQYSSASTVDVLAMFGSSSDWISSYSFLDQYLALAPSSPCSDHRCLHWFCFEK